jgi:hypothetical protein
MVDSQNDSDDSYKRPSDSPTESSPYWTDHGKSPSEYHISDNRREKQGDPHSLIESGCIREFAFHVLRSPTGTDGTDRMDIDIEIHRLAESDARQAVETTQNLDQYERTVSLLQKHGGDRPNESQYTLAVNIVIGRYTWKLVVFKTTYPPVGIVYLIFGRSINRDTGSVAAVIDPESSETGDSDTVIAFKIGAKQVTPTPLTLDQQLTNFNNSVNNSRDSHSPRIGYQIAIDWFVS